MATTGHHVQTMLAASEPGKPAVVELAPLGEHSRWEIAKVIASYCPVPDTDDAYGVRVVSNGKVLWDVDLHGPGPHDCFIPDGLRSEAVGYVEGSDDVDPDRPGGAHIELAPGGDKVIGKLNVAFAVAAY